MFDTGIKFLIIFWKIDDKRMNKEVTKYQRQFQRGRILP